MYKTLRVRLLNHEYPLRVLPADEDRTLAFAEYVEQKLQTFRADHPQQPELTTAVITALALAEELFALRDALEDMDAAFDAEISALDTRLGTALGSGGDGQSAER